MAKFTVRVKKNLPIHKFLGLQMMTAIIVFTFLDLLLLTISFRFCFRWSKIYRTVKAYDMEFRDNKITALPVVALNQNRLSSLLAIFSEKLITVEDALFGWPSKENVSFFKVNMCLIP